MTQRLSQPFTARDRRGCGSSLPAYPQPALFRPLVDFVLLARYVTVNIFFVRFGNLFVPATDVGMASGSARDNLTDGELCEALAAGTLWAVDVFYTRVEETVDAVLFRVLGATDIDPDDLMQQALEKIITLIVAKRFSSNSSLKSWAALVTQEVALDALRARARERGIHARAVGQDTPAAQTITGKTTERPSEVRLDLEAVLTALATTKREWAEAVVLHDLLGFKLSEIAALTGVSTSAAQSRLVRGRHDITSRGTDTVLSRRPLPSHQMSKT